MTRKERLLKAKFDAVEAVLCRFQRYLRFRLMCSTRKKNAKVVRKMMTDYGHGSHFRFVLNNYRWTVIKCQRVVRTFNRCTRARRRALGVMFDRACDAFAPQIRQGAVATLKNQLTFEQMAVLEGRRESEGLNKRWKKTNAKFESLFSRQQEQATSPSSGGGKRRQLVMPEYVSSCASFGRRVCVCVCVLNCC